MRMEGWWEQVQVKGVGEGGEDGGVMGSRWA